MHRVLVTGSRNLDRGYGQGRVLWSALEFELDYSSMGGREGMTLVHGACPTGADALAEDWYWHKIDDGIRGLYIERYPADWSLGRSAGPKRNRVMVDSKPDIVLAFPLGESRGTRGTMKMALEAGIPVKQLGV